MKSLIAALIILSAASSFGAEKPRHNYKCIAATLQAIDSDYYYDLSPEDINTILADTGFAGHDTVVEVTRSCDSTYPWTK